MITNENQMKIQFCNSTQKFLGMVNGKIVAKSKYKHNVEKIMKSVESSKSQDPASDPFGINERFDFVSDLVTMVASRVANSAIITGEGGLGKSYTVIKTLEANGKTDTSNLLEMDTDDGIIERDESMFTVVKGFSTAKGLYRILYEHRNSFLVFDDCDNVLKDPVALNLLKGALDSYDRRIISWNAEMSEKEDLPRSFAFEGGVVFVSNLTLQTLNQALRSRSLCVDLSMTLSQKIERMDTLVNTGSFMPEVELSLKKEALALVNKFKESCSEISLRTLIKVVKIRQGNSTNWEKLAQYVMSH